MAGNATPKLAPAYRVGRGRRLGQAAEQDTTESEWLRGRRLYARGEHLVELAWSLALACRGNDPKAQQRLSRRGEAVAARAPIDARRREVMLATLRAVDATGRARAAAGIVVAIDRDAVIFLRRPDVPAGHARRRRAGNALAPYRRTGEQTDA